MIITLPRDDLSRVYYLHFIIYDEVVKDMQK